MRLPNQLVKVRHVSEDGVDLGVVGDIVAEVSHWGGEERAQPDGAHTQVLEVVQSPYYSWDKDTRRVIGHTVMHVATLYSIQSTAQNGLQWVTMYMNFM